LLNHKIIVHPILFSFLPILFLFQYNINEVPFSDAIIPLVLSIVPVIILWIPLKILFGYTKSSLITSVILLSFVIFANLHNILLDHPEVILQVLGKISILGTIFLILDIIFVIFIIKRKIIPNITSPLNVMSITIVGFLLVSSVGYYIMNPIDENLVNYFSELDIQTPQSDNKPDVYMFVLDEFSGKNTLKLDFDYDLQPFENKLIERGFVVPTSFSNYPNTDFSMPSIMNMMYMDKLVAGMENNSKDFQIALKVLKVNNVMKIFKANDYDIVTFFGGMANPYNTKLVDKKLCAFGGFNPDLTKNFVLTYLPISYFNEILLENISREKLECVFRTFDDNSFDDNSKPKFVLTHLRLPHDPFVYDENGNSVENKNGNDKSAYLSQLKFSETKILEIIDAIQSHSPYAVIILISDHGYRSEINWENPKKIDHMRGFNTITSFYFPMSYDEIPSEISGVNIFRIFFNSYFNADFKILENRHMWYTADKPFDHTEVSKTFKEI
jgi:hypothetical protein